MQSARKYSRKNQCIHFAWRPRRQRRSRARTRYSLRTPLETLYSLSVLLCSVLFLSILVNGKWKVRILKLQRLFISLLQTFLFGNRYRREFFESHSLCRPRATNLSAFDFSRQESRISTCQDIILNLTLSLVLFLVTVQRKTFGV